MCLEEIKMSVKVIIADSHAHSCLLRAVVAEGHAPQYSLFAKRSLTIVHEEPAGSRVAGNVNVWPSVFVQIYGHHGHAITLGGLRDACRPADVGERSIAIVPVQRMLSCWQSARSTFHGNAFPIAIGVFSRNWRMFERETDVVGDEQIKVPVTVVIQEATSGSPSRLLVQKPRGFGHIAESSVAIVAIEDILSVVSAKDIFKAVVVVVSDANRGSPIGRSQASLFRDISECPVTIVLIEPVGRVDRRTFQPCPREQENIHPAVIVIIKESTAAAGGLQDVLLALNTSIDHRRVQPCGRSHIDKVCVETAPRSGLPGQGLRGMGRNTLRKQSFRSRSQ